MTAAEPVAAFREHGVRLGKVDWIDSSLPDLIGLEGPFDVIVLSGSVPEVPRALLQQLKPGGRLAVYVPALSWLYTGMDRKVGHWRRYGRRELVQKLERAGFRVHSARYADSLGVPATLAFKLIDDGKGDVSPKTVAIYDKWIFPLSHLIDKLTGGRLLGKNLAVYAERI